MMRNRDIRQLQQILLIRKIVAYLLVLKYLNRITAINDLLDSAKTKTYQYDALYRLTNATGPWGTISYGYDGVGNRTTEASSEGVTNYSYTANKLISSAGAKAFNFSYDNNGNTVTENQKTFIHNQNQRLIKAVESDKTLGEYVYNANGQRVKKVANGRTTYFVYDSSGNLISEMDGEGLVIADYIYLGSIPIARVDEWWKGMPTPRAPSNLNVIPGDKQLTVSWNASPEPVDGYKVYWGTESRNYTNSKDVGNVNSYTITELTNGATYYVAVTAYADLKETYYYHTDHIGTPVLMTNGSGTIVWEGELLPFGEEYSITGTVTNNLRFPGQYYDSETETHYNMRRTYNPSIGRYVERDPLGLATGINPYIYVRNRPAMLVDPQGLFSTFDAVWHYFFGKGASITLNFSEVDIGLQPKDFEGYNALVFSMYKKEGTLPVDLRTQRNLGGWTGNQRYRLFGAIKSNVCEWSFSGYIGAFNNPFDFNELP